MYGLIHQGLKDMVCSARGEQVWREICEGVNRSSADFDPLHVFPDSDTSMMIGAVAQRLGLTVNEVLHRFGRHWITYTAIQGYGPILDLLGHSFRACLGNLNRMHSHMGAMMPKLQPPRFTVEDRSANQITVHYFSTREGLAPMVVGLLEGLSERFKEPVVIEYIAKGIRSDHDEFDLFFESGESATG
jgi:hypothetical protein